MKNIPRVLEDWQALKSCLRKQILKAEVCFAVTPLTAIEQTIFELAVTVIAYPIMRVFRRKAMNIPTRDII